MTEDEDTLDFITALSSIFRGYGARVNPSRTDPVYLRVVLEDTRIAVGFSIADEAAGSMVMGDFLAQTMDSFFHHLVFISNHLLPRDALDYARNHGIIPLDRDDLELELGKAHLREIEVFHHPRIRFNDGGSGSGYDTGNNHDGISIIRRNLQEAVRKEDPIPELIRVLETYREKHVPPPNEEANSMTPGFPFQVAGETENEGNDAEEIGGSEYLPKDAQLITSEDIPTITGGEGRDPEPGGAIPSGNGAIITPNVPVTRLPDICRKLRTITTAQMELIPYFLFGYTCPLVDKDGTKRNPSSGLLAINGVTLEVEEWEPGFNSVEELRMDYIRLVPRADRKVARDLAFNGVVKLNTKTIEVKAESNGIQRDGSRRILPDTSSITLEYQGLHYFPHWHVRGEGGSMFVDAVNGEIISIQEN